jgi:hypothetical protein
MLEWSLHAGVAELADAHDSKSCGPKGRGGSIPLTSTKRLSGLYFRAAARLMWFLNAVIYYVPILLGLVFVYSALLRYPKPPVKRHQRLLVGLVGASLLYFGIRVLRHSK